MDNKVVKFHFYRKVNTVGMIEADTHHHDICIDGKKLFTIGPGEKNEAAIELQPGKHLVEFVPCYGLAHLALKREIEIDENTTDFYMAFTCGRHIYIYSRAQYNNNEYSRAEFNNEKNVNLVVKVLHSSGRAVELTKITIDGIEYTDINNPEEYQIKIASGKHMFFCETNANMLYSSIDVPEDCDSFIATIGFVNDQSENSGMGGNIKLLGACPVNKSNTDGESQKEIECILKRESRLIGNHMYKVQICIDDYSTFIKGGEIKKTKIKPGKHIVIIKKVSTSETREIEVPENCSAVYITTACGVLESGNTSIVIK